MSAPMPNPFDTNSASHVPVDAGSAAVCVQPPLPTAAEAIPSAALAEPTTRPREATHEHAAIGRTAGWIPATGATDDIPEIFRVAHQLCAGARQFIPDHHAIWDAMHNPSSPRALEGEPTWEDEAPLFLRMAL
jgi:hypothetical protein